MLKSEMQKAEEILFKEISRQGISLKEISSPPTRYHRAIRDQTIRAIIKKTKLTLKDIGNMFGLAPSAVHKIKEGGKNAIQKSKK
ncbi:MAG: hypothetical protein DDT23_00956 [candidate division WS2 bacterium]|nr:hypothetical protein [Candidatus Lithacetigena glycinireducens]